MNDHDYRTLREATKKIKALEKLVRAREVMKDCTSCKGKGYQYYPAYHNRTEKRNCHVCHGEPKDFEFSHYVKIPATIHLSNVRFVDADDRL